MDPSLESYKKELHDKDFLKDLVDNRIWREKKQAGAVYIKFFVYLLVYVYLYTHFQKSRAPWSVEFQWNSLSNLQKTFPFS